MKKSAQRKTSAKPAARSIEAKRTAYGTVGKMNGAFGVAVMSADQKSTSGEPRSVTCHGFERR